MRTTVVKVLIALTAFVALFAIGLYAPAPVLFTLEGSPASASHYNPLAFQGAARPDTDTLLPLMAELLNGSGTVVLTIRSGDLDAAEQELQKLAEKARLFDTIVVPLEVSESELARFREQTESNIADLDQLLNQTREFERLNRLEVRYRQENSSLVYRIAYEGEALRLKMDETYRRYASRQPAVLDLSRTFGLDTGPYESGVENIQEIVTEAGERQDERAASPVDSPYRLTLRIEPMIASYSDLLTISGTIAPNGTAVAIFIDGEEQASIPADASGRFSWAVRIGHTQAGRHLVYAACGGAFSETAVFTIEPLPTELTLQAATERVNGTAGAACTGSLSSAGVPVGGAPVLLVADGNTTFATQTQVNGTFSRHLPLAPGRHTIVARFSDPGFPLNASESAPVTLDIPESLPLGSVLLSLLPFTLFLVGAFVYIHLGGLRYPEAPRAAAPAATPPARPAERTPSPDEPLARFRSAAEAGNGGEALQHLYLHLLDRFDGVFAIPSIRSLTPREVSRRIGPPKTAEPFRLFVQIHERVRYGSEAISPDQLDDVSALFRHILDTLERDRH